MKERGLRRAVCVHNLAECAAAAARSYGTCWSEGRDELHQAIDRLSATAAIGLHAVRIAETFLDQLPVDLTRVCAQHVACGLHHGFTSAGIGQVGMIDLAGPETSNCGGRDPSNPNFLVSKHPPQTDGDNAGSPQVRRRFPAKRARGLHSQDSIEENGLDDSTF